MSKNRWRAQRSPGLLAGFKRKRKGEKGQEGDRKGEVTKGEKTERNRKEGKRREGKEKGKIISSIAP